MVLQAGAWGTAPRRADQRRRSRPRGNARCRAEPARWRIYAGEVKVSSRYRSVFVALPARLSPGTLERVARVARWLAFGLLVLYAVSYVQFGLRLIDYPFG